MLSSAWFAGVVRPRMGARVMCGICGIAHPGGSVDRCVIDAMATTLLHRGPEDHGAWVQGQVGLASTRLSFIDIPGGHQPLSNADGTIWATQNGEIYNYAALRDDLLARGHVFRSHSDTEVLAHMYEEYGDRFVERLHG